MRSELFDVLKLDRRFVAALRGADPRVSPVAPTVEMVRGSGCELIAVGIEEVDELDGLLAIGCRLGQGHLFGAAADAETVSARLGLPRTA